MSKKNKRHCERGIIALFPTIIISSILLILCIGVSQSFLAFLYRVTIFDEKIQSALVTESCVLRVLAKHIQDHNYKGGENILIEDSLCYVGTFSTTTSFVSVKIGDAISILGVHY